MYEVTLKDILLVIQRTINSVDNRLENHGEEVGYLCVQMGLAMGYSEEQLLPLCALAMMHDVGAYKVEERLRMTEFEVELPHEHAIYGSLFVQHFSPFRHMANTIFYHHWRYEDRYKIVDDRLIPSEAFLIHLADRVSVLYAHSGQQLAGAIQRQIPRSAGTVFDPKHVDALLQLVDTTDVIEKIIDGRYLEEFYDYLDRTLLTSEQTISYLCMLVYIIEFRSRSTVTHSVSVESGTQQIAQLMGMSESDRNVLSSAALLHDVGKMITPIEILTKPGRLTDSEMEVMRRHVVTTSEIIRGNGLGQLKDIASNHHEKLNGKGYPKGLSEQELCTKSRIIAVADILAALVEPRYYKPALCKADVLEIMGKAAAARDIDPDIYAIVRDNYEQITCEMEKQQKVILSLYDHLESEYEHLRQEAYSTLSNSVIGETIPLKAA